ncbi:hypothetical protein DX130_17045 [Paenibacillus paeoniae]|uniref:Uncharacterized protein n=1 Tax=Paenibacillus paeoniae TaxID=2292705 RepID=A0A371PEC7_9BACL|nr:hypothetical protein DX130_17045 [Paenibacillus paeoniae]
MLWIELFIQFLIVASIKDVFLTWDEGMKTILRKLLLILFNTVIGIPIPMVIIITLDSEFNGRVLLLSVFYPLLWISVNFILLKKVP